VAAQKLNTDTLITGYWSLASACGAGPETKIQTGTPRPAHQLLVFTSPARTN
jgi:hypothetical protein